MASITLVNKPLSLPYLNELPKQELEEYVILLQIRDLREISYHFRPPIVHQIFIVDKIRYKLLKFLSETPFLQMTKERSVCI